MGDFLIHPRSLSHPQRAARSPPIPTASLHLSLSSAHFPAPAISFPHFPSLSATRTCPLPSSSSSTAVQLRQPAVMLRYLGRRGEGRVLTKTQWVRKFHVSEMSLNWSGFCERVSGVTREGCSPSGRPSCPRGPERMWKSPGGRHSDLVQRPI